MYPFWYLSVTWIQPRDGMKAKLYDWCLSVLFSSMFLFLLLFHYPTFPPPPTVIWVIFVPKIFYQQADRRSHAKKLLNTWNRQLNLLLCVRATGGRGVVVGGVGVGGVGVGGRFSPLREETRTLSCLNPQPFYGLTSQSRQSSSSLLSNIRHSPLDYTTSTSPRSWKLDRFYVLTTKQRLSKTTYNLMHTYWHRSIHLYKMKQQVHCEESRAPSWILLSRVVKTLWCRSGNPTTVDKVVWSMINRRQVPPPTAQTLDQAAINGACTLLPFRDWFIPCPPRSLAFSAGCQPKLYSEELLKLK